MFNGVGHIAEFTIDLRLMQSAVQESTGWPDKRQTGPILCIAWLFTYE
jgi:hypothetical protein